MSEYQYYEFQAIDRPLTRAQMAALRACSSRATITSTRFVNSYSYGRFKGDERKEEDDGLMASLVPLRGELAGGDLRPLYLAWLGRAQAGELDPDAVEPPPPPGLGSLTAPQEALADFLRLDRDLLLAAAAGGPPSSPPMDVGDLRAWVRELPESKKSELLVGLLRGDGDRLRSDIVRDVRRTAKASAGLVRRPPRTVASIVEHGAMRSRARATGRGRRRLPAEE